MAILSETTYAGYIDFGRMRNAFKTYALNVSSSVNMTAASYTWLV
jgi:hypothetical protein